MQTMDVAHNKLVTGTGQLTKEQKEVNQQIVELTNGINGVRQDTGIMRDIVNADNQDNQDKVDTFIAPADATMLRAQFRIAAVEADVQRLAARTTGHLPRTVVPTSTRRAVITDLESSLMSRPHTSCKWASKSSRIHGYR